MTPNSPNLFSHIPKPAKLAEKLLSFCLHQVDKEVVLGDFEEEYYLIAVEFGVRQARHWYWFEILKSMPHLLFINFGKLIRSKTMNRNNQLALLGLVLMLPAFLLVLGGVAQSGFGTTKINDVLNYDLFFFRPIVIIGGLMLAFVLNLLPVLPFNYRDGVLVCTLTIRDRILNLGLISGIGLLFTIIFLYLLAENFQIFQYFSLTPHVFYAGLMGYLT